MPLVEVYLRGRRHLLYSKSFIVIEKIKGEPKGIHLC